MDNRSPTVAGEADPAKELRKLFLMLFLRGRGARHAAKSAAPKSIAQKLALTLAVYALFGLFALFVKNQPLFLLSSYLHAMSLAFLGMFVASSAGEILFNQEEADILMHRPIEPRTLLWAKVRVLTEVSTWLACSFNLAGFVIGAVSRHGGWLYPAAHLISTILQAFFCTGLVVLVYQFCLRWFGRERLEGLMTTAQVVLSLVVVLGSQLLPRLLDVTQLDAGPITMKWWMILLPPAWFAGFDDALAGDRSIASWGLGLMGCAVTAAIFWLAFNRLAKDYHSGLQSLNERTGSRVRQGGARRWLARLVEAPPLKWWLRDPRERAAFLLVAAYLVRDRDVKLRVYPAIAPFVIMPIVFMLNEIRDRGPMPGFGFSLAAGYVCTVPMFAAGLLQLSQHWQAADLFRIAPIHGPAPLGHGMRKAVLAILTLPVVMTLFVCGWLIQHDVSTLALLLPGLIVLPIVAIIPQLGGKAVPLSRPTEEAKSASRGLLFFVALFGTMILSGLAMGARVAGLLGWMILAESILTGVVYVLMRRSINRAGWPPLD